MHTTEPLLCARHFIHIINIFNNILGVGFLILRKVTELGFKTKPYMK